MWMSKFEAILCEPIRKTTVGQGCGLLLYRIDSSLTEAAPPAVFSMTVSCGVTRHARGFGLPTSMSDATAVTWNLSTAIWRALISRSRRLWRA